MIKLSKTYKKLSPEDIEKNLLSGSSFNDVKGIIEIDDIFNSFYNTSSKIFKPNKQETKPANVDLNKLDADLKKQHRALERLENLYLYAEDEMSEKDYILKKNIINTKIKEIDTKIKSSATISTSTYNINFFLNTATLELSKEIIEGNINMKSLIQRVGRDIIKEFVNSLITKITVRDRKVISIQFTNGLISTFIYEV